MQKNRSRRNGSNCQGIGEPVSGDKQYCAPVQSVDVKLKDAISGDASFSSSPQPTPIRLEPLTRITSGGKIKMAVTEAKVMQTYQNGRNASRFGIDDSMNRKRDTQERFRSSEREWIKPSRTQ